MTTASKSKGPHLVLSALQTFLRPEDPSADAQQKLISLTVKLHSAIALLPTTPVLHDVALETIAMGYQLLFTQHEQSVPDIGLSSALSKACDVLDSLLAFCPEGWSPKILKWGVGLMGQLSLGRSAPPTLEDALRVWLTHPALTSVNDFISKCIEYLVSSGNSQQCMECVFTMCSAHSPHLKWLLTYVISQHPSHLIPSLLSLTLKTCKSSDLTFTTVCSTLEFLARSHKDTLRKSVVGALEGVLVEGQWGRLLVLLQLTTHSQAMLTAISSDCLKVVTPSRIQAIVAESEKAPPPEESHDSHMTEEEEDEGEIHSDEEMEDEQEKREAEEPTVNSAELVANLSELVCSLRGSDAGMAINFIMETYREMKQQLKTQEEALEEGEILKVSPVRGVVEGCERVMSVVLLQLHSAAQHHMISSGHTPSGGIELAVTLHSGLGEWCRLLMRPQQDPVCQGWLKELLGCVSVCGSELQAAGTLSQLLCACSHREQLSDIIPVFQQVESRHPGVAMTTIHSALAALHHQSDSAPLENLVTSLLGIVNGLQLEDSSSRQLRSHFLEALSAYTLPLVQLLPHPGGSRLLDILLSLPVGSGREGHADLCALLRTCLSHYFSLIQRASAAILEGCDVDMDIEASLGKCRQLVARWTRDSDGARVFVYTVTMDTILSKEMNCHSKSTKKGVPKSHVNLLSTNQRFGLSYGPKFNARQQQHGWTIKRKHPAREHEDCVQLSIVYSTNHIVQLLSSVARGNTRQLSSVFLDRVSPNALQLKQWPEEDLLKYTLEWDLNILRQFSDNPILWEILLLIAQDPTGLEVCAPVVRSLLTVLSQFWQRCHLRNCNAFPSKLESSVLLIEAMATAKWLPPPLAYIGELFAHVTPHEIYLLLYDGVYKFMKDNFNGVKCGTHSEIKDTGYKQLMKGVLIKNIETFGPLFARYFSNDSST